ncbi:TPA: hypothetical protein HA338_02940 [Methanosarcina acetivorans]|uniref:Uncharacterized protein n=1 Tax=Methanosarcina acetivorans TaxID=2214 RepID=A0A832SHG8_9EURY|nr:hypothetical protein [Methanosarcina acetivorans]HIH93022.1 hypothetical protein [Methanosarcina acetivorans]
MGETDISEIDPACRSAPTKTMKEDGVTKILHSIDSFVATGIVPKEWKPDLTFEDEIVWKGWLYTLQYEENKNGEITKHYVCLYPND